MRIVYDPPKRQKNIKDHGLDFAALTEDFFIPAMIVTAKKGRFMAIGLFEGHIISVVFTKLGSEAVSVVSMRDASRKERKAYAR